MKEGIHPKYNPVVFIDTGINEEFISRSTMKSDEVRKIDGVDHYVIRLEISAASHPFFTGQQRFVDTAGRIEKFQRKYRKTG
jgi:large subunit ribosomal protein L31